MKWIELLANLEAILDGIAHGIGDELYIIVKHKLRFCEMFANI